jgi:DNA segregation ATPase FtsK/SpoIIIE, S-DNA-T family
VAEAGASAAASLLRSLRSEIEHRVAAGSGPRLVVLVDDVDAVAGGLDTTVDTLAELAGRGATVGVHVVVASRRWAGPVQRAAAAVPGPRVALRLPNAADANALVGTVVPTRTSRRTPGRAVLATDERVRSFQVATLVPPRAEVPVEVVDLDGREVPSSSSTRSATRARLAEVVDAIVASGATAAPPLDAAIAREAEQAPVLQLTDLVGGPVADLDVAGRRTARADPLVVQVGAGAGGREVTLDLREAAQGGDGPHGVLIGATGSGKSELLRTVLASLVLDHGPDELALVLVDFKGGATFAPFASLPHVAGVITNLADDLAMIDRTQAALAGEMRRRQEVLSAHGQPSLVAYAERRRGDPSLPALPSLLVVVDEFAELLTERPEFLETLNTIGRVGRSLGVHLLLASQRLEEGRLRGLDSHLRYRLALRTFNAADSRAVLGSTQAAELPSAPGAGYLQRDGQLTRFQAAYVSGATADGRTELDELVDRLHEVEDERVHQVWLPPLPAVVPLDHVLGGVDVDTSRGLHPPHWPGTGQLLVPVGITDQPARQRQAAHVLDLSGGGGNVLVLGAPRTGRTTTLRTLVAALALTHTPLEAQVYGIDHGGGGLEALTGLPHVGSVAGRRDLELTRRLVRHVRGVLAWREARFERDRVDSIAAYREARATGRITDDPFGDVVLVIDGWTSFRNDLPDLEPIVAELVARGLGYGVHVWLSASRSLDLRAGLRDGLGTTIELRISEPIETTVDRKAAAAVPSEPGRGLAPGGDHLKVALPRIDGEETPGTEAAGLADLVARTAAAWSGPTAPPVRTLPQLVRFTDLPAPSAQEPAGVPVGVEELGLAPLYLDLTGEEPHLLVLGDGESGRTTLLRTFLTGLAVRNTPDEARVVLIDHRRTLLGAVPDELLLAYAAAGPATTEIVERLRLTIEKRLPGSDVTAQQLRDRSWWEGPELYVVVDDADLLPSGASNPLAPLAEHLPQARDVGVHLIVARRTSGTARAFDPVLQRLRELGTQGLLLSGDRAEGPLLHGIRAEELPVGRARLVRRRASPVQVQLAHTPPG